MDTPDLNTIAKLQELLESRDFAHLSPTEKRWVKDHFGEASYEELKTIIHSARKIFAEESEKVKVNPDTRNLLMSRFDQVYQKNQPVNAGILKNLLQYRIRLIIALPAAVGLVLIAITFFLKLSQDHKVEVRTVTITDTVFIERDNENTTALNNNESAAAKEKSVREIRPLPTTDHSLPDEIQGQIRNLALLTDMSRQSRRGSNARDDSTLLKLLVTVN